ncbi:Protein FAR1-related sequence 3 [Vitis vinifera]|uniref:Protein FAR1-related sequence 3 n=1 Tax=Vitis vinifera TaxID=29760 RepID=A0A438JC98_VITVI|nr:Protein FAR1-related sequence 3 [Vitis vinifera]
MLDRLSVEAKFRAMTKLDSGLMCIRQDTARLWKKSFGETEVQFRLTRVTLEPMLRSMAYISQQLSTPANRVAVINLKLQDTKTTSGETEVKFQVSRDTLGSMLRSMAYIREQL